jgi:hypothetical protein
MVNSNKIEIRYLETGEYEQWDHFVDESEFGTIFQKSIWLKPLAEFQHLSFSIAACFKGGKMIGGMAFTWKKKFGLLPIIQIPLKTPFFGPVFVSSNTKYRSRIESQLHTVMVAFNDFILSRYQHFPVSFPPAICDIRPYSWNGFETGVRYTYVSELNPDIQLQEDFDSDIRRRIKKAGELEHEVSIDNSDKYITHAWDLEQQSFRRHHFQQSGFSKQEFLSFIKTLSGEGSSMVFSMIHDGAPIASVVTVHEKTRGIAYYWQAGANKEYLSTGLNQLLIQRVIEHYTSEGYKKFDLLGADTDTIARYKSTFNFPLVPMYSVSKSRGISKFGLMIKKFL